MIQLTKEKYNELQNNLAKMFPACEDKNGLMAIAMAAINYYEEEAYLCEYTSDLYQCLGESNDTNAEDKEEFFMIFNQLHAIWKAVHIAVKESLEHPAPGRMTNVEMINSKYNEIMDELKKVTALSYRHPKHEYRVYIDSNGEVGHEEWETRTQDFLRFDDPSYYRIYFCHFCGESYSILWDSWFEDSDEFAKAFRERFGVGLMTEKGRTKEEDGEATILEAGLSLTDYRAWLDECTEKAIVEDLSSELCEDSCMDYIEQTIEYLKYGKNEGLYWRNVYHAENDD